ncbi:unnamed protein product [Acanthoscelides obtectus]|uniref:DDE-1 domain-containing protein n=1 Tax=Acanthoscelides obtectus TaxID=200917 RepID=A0A9P0Q548_ACAOB|nr:unnamed protein product [Acanthoscelides obtectus]CAK1652603.1 Jerky protein homolog-like [Acanthoscelides obtectus]
MFDPSMTPTAAQEKFLANVNNKQRFITMLSGKLEQRHLNAVEAEDDADLIINTAIELTNENRSIIVGNDMPRNCVKKSAGPSYTSEDIRRAVEDVANKNKTYRAAQEFYGVPKSVICQRLTGKRRTPIVLSAEVENTIEKCILARAEYGYPCGKNELQDLVKTYVESKELQTSFKNNRPGDDWYYDFLKMHPALSVKKPELLQKLRKDARKPEVVYNFYEILRQTLISKACFIYNADESGFPSDPSRIRAIDQKGRPLCRVSGGSGRENTTVLACIGADGSVLPPLVVFTGAAVQPRWVSEKEYPGTRYTTSSNGWMEEPQFFHWFTSTFIPHIQKVREEKLSLTQYALLIFDGHASHMSVRILEEAINNNIILIKLPSHLADRLQPLDKCVFGPVKTCWEKELISLGEKKMGSGSGRLTKVEFSEVLGTVRKKSMTYENIISGFKTTGIFLVDSTKFSISEFTGNSVDSTLQEREKMQPPNVSYLHSCFQAIISSTSQSSATDISNQPLVLQTSLQQIDMSDEPTTSQVNTHQMIDSQNATQNTNVSKKPSDLQIAATNGSEIENLFFKRTELEDVVQQKTTNVRLKQKTYSEVLTTEDVLKRLKEAEEKKQLKKKRPKLQNTETKTIKVKKLKKQKWTLTENDSDSSLDENDEDEIDIKAC